jgi:hypothetical protein
MRNRLTKLMLSGAAAVAVVALTASTALATAKTTWTVSPGGSIAASGSGQVKDTKTGTVAKCTSIKTSGTLKSGSGLSGTDLGTISAGTFTGCTIATISVTVTTEDLPWHLNATSYDSSTGVTSGTLTGVELAASATGCSATLEGTTATNGKIKVTFTNSTGVLKLLGSGGNLTAEDVDGCFGLVNDGDHQDASGSLTVTPKQTITGS